MTNLEKYKDDIINEIETSNLANLSCNIRESVFGGYGYGCMNRSCQKCAVEVVEWFTKEYEDPSPYEDWKIDDKIEVSDDGEHWYKRYFAEISENGKPMCWMNGVTSWSCENDERFKQEWNSARKVEE